MDCFDTSRFAIKRDLSDQIEIKAHIFHPIPSSIDQNVHFCLPARSIYISPKAIPPFKLKVPSSILKA